jgi:hypothetical protein
MRYARINIIIHCQIINIGNKRLHLSGIEKEGVIDYRKVKGEG